MNFAFSENILNRNFNFQNNNERQRRLKRRLIKYTLKHFDLKKKEN